MKSSLRTWRWLAILAALEAGAAFVVLTQVPREGSGISISRLTMLAFLALGILTAGWLAMRPPTAVQRLGQRRFAAVGIGAALVLATLLFLLRYAEPERMLPYYHRLAPVLWYLLFLSGELAAFSLVVSRGIHAEAVRARRTTWRSAGLAFIVLIMVYLFVAASRIGLTPDSAYWAEPGVPLLGWQLGIALMAGAAVLTVEMMRQDVSRSDVALGVVIWMAAGVLWLSVPDGVMKNSFYAPINPPANQPFPNSDAGYYDSMAQSLLIGHPYQGDIPTRPLYITVLAGLHALVGERYSLLIAGQTLLLALIPVVLYLLGAQLHSRAAGVLAALAAMFREWNSLLISSQTRVSNTKTLLADLPTLLLVLLACLLVMRWLQRRSQNDALLAGGSLGLLLLLRTQSLLLIPAAAVVALLAHGVRGRDWQRPLALFFLGVVAGVTPWLAHNYLRSGQITLDAPFEYQVIASQYKYTGNLDINAADLQGKGVAGLLLAFVRKDPQFVAGFISSHFFATLVDSVLVLPLRARYDGLFAPLNLYWMSWPEKLDPLNAVLLIPYLAVIAVGLGAAWRRLGWAGLVPLAFSVAYAAANGIGRFSGWRYDLPADWIAYFYLAIGGAELLSTLMGLFGASARAAAPAASQVAAFQRSAAGVALMAIMLISALPWMAEYAAAPRYAKESAASLLDMLGASPAVKELGVGRPQMEAFLAQPRSSLQIGRLLYPRYFPRGAGLPSAHPWPAYAVRDFPRTGFLLLNQTRHDALIPLRQPASGFEQGADAIVLGCQHADHLEARLVLFPGRDLAYAGAPLTDVCD